MKRTETDKFKIPTIRGARRETRFSDSYHWTRATESRSTTTASNRERGGGGVNGFQRVDRAHQQHRFQHNSTGSSSSGPSCPPPSSSAGGSGGGSSGTHRSLKKYTSTKLSGLRYKFHSDKNGNIAEKVTDDEEENGVADKRNNLEPENLGEERRQADKVTGETVNPESLEIQKSSKDCNGLVDPPAIQIEEVDEASDEDDDDDEDDADILIIDLSDQERAEMESWAK